MSSALPIDEAARVQALGRYRILDTAPEQEFDDLVRLAGQICKAPLALISFVDTDRVWFKSRLGLEATEIAREGSFCSYAILQSDLFIIADATSDKRFKRSRSFGKFYAGMPLVTAEGLTLGTLCVMDHQSRSLNQGQQEALRALARQVMSQLDLRSSTAALTSVISELNLEIGELKHAEEAMREREARLTCVLESHLTGVAFVNSCGDITEANDTFLRMVGYTRDDVHLRKLRWPAITTQDEKSIQDIKSVAGGAPAEKELVRRDGSRVPVLFQATALTASSEEFACSLLDLTENKQAQERVNYLAYHDALTNLPNQVLFKDRLQQALTLTRRNEQMLAVMLVNLDRFKVINDTLGYAAGDRVLNEVAQRLTACVREGDTVARFGSDEFALLLTRLNRAEDAAKMAQDIKEALNLPFSFNDQELFITGSIGISLHPYDGKDTMALLKGAGTALYRAKEQNGNTYEFYTAGRTTKALKQLVLENNMRPGLEREEFVLHYQPQVNMGTAQLVGMEALVRWQHPGLGLLYPAEFIVLAEDSGLIVPIGEWVLRTACEQSKSWQDAGFEPLRLAVNLSARQFQQPKLVETVAHILKETGLNPHCLELELSEGSIMKDPEQVTDKLRELKQMGVQIAVDDFGTGYSSLNYLKRFPIDTLKVDQSFVQEISTDVDDAAIVTAIITLAHALKLNVIAEGVETQEQLEFLRTLECDEVQGFLFSKPLSADDFTQLLMERRRLSARPDYSTTRLPRLSGVLRQTG